MKIKTAVLLFIVILSSCSSKNSIYLFTDKYSSGILDNTNIIEEFSRISKKYNYKLHQIKIDSETDFKSALNSSKISDNDKVVTTSYSYISFFSEEAQSSGKVFIIGPLFDIRRENIEITGNLGTVSSDSFSSLKLKGISFYTENGDDSYPEKEIISSVKKSLKKDGNPLSVTISNFSSVKTEGFRNPSHSGISVIVPESSLYDAVNRLQDMKNRYVLYDFGNLSELNLLNTFPDPLFTIKYSYEDSFEAALLFDESISDKKYIYPAYFEKK